MVSGNYPVKGNRLFSGVHFLISPSTYVQVKPGNEANKELITLCVRLNHLSGAH